MAYWWVSQRQTWKQESAGGYLWAPKRDADGHPLHHWETMTRVREGDTIFSYVNQAIVAISIAKGRAYDARLDPKIFARTSIGSATAGELTSFISTCAFPFKSAASPKN